jgi:hypothetical protein
MDYGAPRGAPAPRDAGRGALGDPLVEIDADALVVR